MPFWPFATTWFLDFKNHSMMDHNLQIFVNKPTAFIGKGHLKFIANRCWKKCQTFITQGYIYPTVPAVRVLEISSF
jgi:hypothetical protein